MLDYEKNWQTSMGGHLGYENIANSYSDGDGDINSPTPKWRPHGSSSYDIRADVRDALNYMVASGNVSLKDNTARGYFQFLKDKLGDENANKLLSQAYLFTKRPEFQSKSPEERIMAFYEIGSNDPYVHSELQKIKNFGQGVLEGFRESSAGGIQEITGKTRKPTEDEIKKSVLANSNLEYTKINKGGAVGQKDKTVNE